jgi:transmembrane 9 superfamily protein 2/4
LINSTVIVVFLCVMVSMILLRSVSRDVSVAWSESSLAHSAQIHRYNALDTEEDVQEDYGWKLVHGEVFRTPQNPLLLSVFVGNGAQLGAMAGVTLGLSGLLFWRSSC